jgi:hypothetical protein
MTDEDEDRRGLPDGHRYDAPESDDSRVSKEWVYAALGILVLLLLVLVATGAVQVYPSG